MDRPTGFEYKHIEVPQNTALVDDVTNAHAMFYWEVQSTQTVVSKESHIEQGQFNPDNLYSVVTTERFVAIDFRRPTNTPNLARIKPVERQYFQICSSLVNLGASPLDNYSTIDVASLGFVDITGISTLLAFLNPRFWAWIYSFGYLRDFKDIGITGVFFMGYGFRKRGEGKRLSQYEELKKQLDTLLQKNKEILNISN